MHAMPRWPGAVALLGLCLFLFFWGLGRIPFYTKGEPREALEVWEEVHAGEWILPLRNGRELPSKPPLFHWLGGIVSLVRGEVDELSIRLPSALLATASVLLVFWLGSVKWGTTAGIASGAILATNFEWLRAATTARVDMTLTAFLVGAFVALERSVASARPSRGALVALYLCTGLAALGKGPVGLVLPALVGLVYLGIRGDLGRIWQMRPIVGGLVAVAIAGSWYAAAIATGGSAFVWKHLWVENLSRFVAADESGAGHVHPWYYLVGGFFAGFAPWSALLPPLGIYLWSRRRELEAKGYLYPLVWFAVPFLFYSVSESKRTVYLLPIYPAAALLIGAWWSRLVEKDAEMPAAVERALRVVGAALVGIIVLLVVVLFGEHRGVGPLGWFLPLLHEKDQANIPVVQQLIRDRFPILVAWLAVLTPVIALFHVSLRRRRWSLVLATLVGFMASSVAVVNTVFHPEIARRRTFKPLMALVRDIVGEDDELYFYQTFDYGAVFYSHRHITPLHDELPRASKDRRAYVLMWESVWKGLNDGERARLRFLERSHGNGPKGRDRLVLALVKEDAVEATASAADQNG